ncbi:hypothetical protein ABZ348_02735 [Streptomyces sp. NPDC005963]
MENGDVLISVPCQVAGLGQQSEADRDRPVQVRVVQRPEPLGDQIP